MNLVRALRRFYIPWAWDGYIALNEKATALRLKRIRTRYNSPEYHALTKKVQRVEDRQRRAGLRIGMSEHNIGLPTRKINGRPPPVPPWLLNAAA